MRIESMKSGNQPEDYITVTFGYDEIKQIANACYYAFSAFSTPVNTQACINACFLFNMIKHGNIQPETLKYIKYFEENNIRDESNN